ncbi:unnamed protein product, partial [Eretmochelys imbricata]
CIRSRKPVKEPVGPLDGRDAKGALKDDKAIAEKLNEFFASVFTAEDEREIPKPEPFFLDEDTPAKGFFDEVTEDEVVVLQQMFFGVVICALATLAAKGDMVSPPSSSGRWQPWLATGSRSAVTACSTGS